MVLIKKNVVTIILTQIQTVLHNLVNSKFICFKMPLQVTKVVNTLNNGNVHICDHLSADIIKYGPSEIHKAISKLLNYRA